MHPDEYPDDIVHPARAKVVPVVIPEGIDPLSPDTVSYVWEAFMNSAQHGVNVRAVILCNPHNPLARCYPVETILEYAKFAQEVRANWLYNTIGFLTT
jgi:1-aminocyclopropane-1-carboxylate synthase